MHCVRICDHFAAPADYESITTFLTFSPGDERQCVEVNATEDDDTEGTEQFNITITSTDDVNLDPDTAIINILDGNGK